MQHETRDLPRAQSLEPNRLPKGHPGEPGRSPALTGSGAEAGSVLLQALDEAFDRKSWHGTNLRGSVRGMTAEQAAWRPAPGRHNIWEIVVHAAYWKYTVRRRLLGEKRGSFTLKGSNWFPRPEGEASEVAWRTDVALLVAEHQSLRAAVEAWESGRDSGVLTRDEATHLVIGIAFHDIYHAGQIQLIKRLRQHSGVV